MKNKTRRHRLILVSLTAALILLFLGKSPVQRWLVRGGVARSARDIQALGQAIAMRTLDYGPWSMYPDFVFESVESRQAYGVDTTMPQELVDKLGNTGPNDPPPYKQLSGTPWETNMEYLLRLRRWEFLLWSCPELPVAQRAVEKGIADGEARRELRGEADALGIDYREHLISLGLRSGIPRDPFALDAGERAYRYGRPPDAVESNWDFGTYCMWVIAGNGPDGDADLDVRKFNPVKKTGADDGSRFDLGFGVEPLDLIYDPTNGLVSNGDIVLFSDLSILGFDKALWDPDCFRERYN